MSELEELQLRVAEARERDMRHISEARVSDLEAEVAGLHLALTTVERLMREERAKAERLNDELDRCALPEGEWARKFDDVCDQRDMALAKVARVDALARLLVSDGHLTPMGKRQIDKIVSEPAAPQSP